MNQPYIMYGNPQMYSQQGNIPIIYGGQPVVIAQPNGIQNNSNMINAQFSNLPAVEIDQLDLNNWKLKY